MSTVSADKQRTGRVEGVAAKRVTGDFTQVCSVSSRMYALVTAFQFS